MSKSDEGKYEPTLVYISFIKAIAKHRRYGINKHGDKEDWRTTEPIKHIEAALRHINAFAEGEEFDPDATIQTSHLAAAATNLMFEIERMYGPKKECKHKNLSAEINTKDKICLDCGQWIKLMDTPKCKHSRDSLMFVKKVDRDYCYKCFDCGTIVWVHDELVKAPRTDADHICPHMRMFRPWPSSRYAVCLDCNKKLSLYGLY